MLVDPYFQLDHLLPLLEHSTVTRLLTSRKGGKARIGALVVQLCRMSKENRELEIRVGDGLHDRFIIPKSGSEVDQIGTSLSGIGKSFTVLTTIRYEGAVSAIREHHESAWAQAEKVYPPPDTAATDEEPDADDEGEDGGGEGGANP